MAAAIASARMASQSIPKERAASAAPLASPAMRSCDAALPSRTAAVELLVAIEVLPAVVVAPAISLPGWVTLAIVLSLLGWLHTRHRTRKRGETA